MSNHSGSGIKSISSFSKHPSSLPPSFNNQNQTSSPMKLDRNPIMIDSNQLRIPTYLNSTFNIQKSNIFQYGMKKVNPVIHKSATYLSR